MIHFYSYNVKDEYGDKNGAQCQDRDGDRDRDRDQDRDGYGHIVVAPNSTSLAMTLGHRQRQGPWDYGLLMAQLQWRHSKILTFCAAA